MRKRGQQREKEDEEAVASVMKSMLDKVETDVDYETGPFQLTYESNFANKVLIVFIFN
jgi:CRISPR/Cas system CSM-associated protein Csm2 small subunit